MLCFLSIAEVLSGRAVRDQSSCESRAPPILLALVNRKHKKHGPEQNIADDVGSKVYHKPNRIKRQVYGLHKNKRISSSFPIFSGFS
jgi:hypothetical protein